MLIRSHWKQSEMTAEPSKYPQKKFKDKPCKWCNEDFSPRAPSHLYCSDACKDEGLADNYYTNMYNFGAKKARKLLKDQGYACAICRKDYERLNLDHCHSTGKVRGFLCHNCNRGIGLFKDDPMLMKAAASYLEGATTIPEGSTSQAIGDGSAQPQEIE